MQGNILTFSVQENQGLVSGDDGQRYTFTGPEWRETTPPFPGERVDFQPEGDKAVAVYRLTFRESGVPGAQKSKIAAGLFGIFLGWLGIHKFYLGYSAPGVIMLLCGTLGWFLFLPGMAVVIIGLIEGIIYLTKSDQDFYHAYELNKRSWF